MEPPMWLRGRARHDAGMIMLDEPEQYSIYGNKGLVFELAGIREPDEAVAFATTYGLLWHGADSEDRREPFERWMTEAGKLTNLLRLHRDIQDAVKGNTVAIDDLRVVFEPIWRHAFEEAATTDAEILHQAQVMLAAWISEAMDGTTEGMTPGMSWEGGQPGEFRMIGYPPHLLAAIYHEFALFVTQRWTALICPECGRSFLPTDARQRYCTPTCSNRARFKRFAERKRERESAGVPVDVGDERG